MDNTLIIEKLNAVLSSKFDDYRGAYFFGSRLTGDFTKDSDYDVVLIFDVLDREKQRLIMRAVSELEYELDVFLDCKLFTSTGSRSIDYIRKNVNPVFIERAIDLGKYYARA
jgi:predicted nucleotidyltransferase